MIFMTDNVLSLSPLSHSSIPLHTQLRDVLRARILDGEYRKTARCPPKASLARCSKSAASPCARPWAICKRKG
ncbi:hypothetical protein EMIT0P294_10954 [Pseudomonas sp. IT-P294]